MSIVFSVQEAKSQLSRLLALAESGEQIEITRHGKVIALVTGATTTIGRPGSGIGTVHYSEGSFDFTPCEIDEMSYAGLSNGDK
jgi:prevent-host-death family protein